MTAYDDLCYLPATEMAAAIRTRALSPVEIIDALLARIERVNPRLNAFTVILIEEARAAAREREAEALRGELRGPLHGVPFSIKDLTMTRGVLTARGSIAFKDWVPEENALLVDRLLASGGVFFAKTTTPEFGNKGVTESPLTGLTNNPWNAARTAGGSSGGAAAQVAAGMGPLAHGSDGAGSIRIPAAMCGVVGLKPSYGRVPSYPPPSFTTYAVQGPIARTVADTALMLSAIAGVDDRDPLSLSDAPADYVASLEGASVKGLRVAYSADAGLGTPVVPEVAAIAETAARRFADLDAHVEEATPDVPHPQEQMLNLWSVAYGVTVTDLVLPRVSSRDDIDPAMLEFLARAERLNAMDYQRVNLFRSEYTRRMLTFYERYDLLLTPTLATAAFPHPEPRWLPGPAELGGRPIDPFLGWLHTYPFNLTGQPAATVPCGFTADGLPVGLQIVGRPRQDAAVLRAAAAFEQAAPWHDRRPPLDDD